ncbi:uncharacterized protein B0H18DRAFT_203929 [Fomitopsis serialis]|uniref:uncharacterized protein n=1 Tax=Fomitopsis serialis TaxID=139415 RepID=UPI002008541E|nr:uncharacterized protein B0H18DRAFT_203929 [Neoantrodia serialis]KAH9937642.1 hypothetical protein B0H18DRAFT_203929 [Neoantrodia serialis]
MPPLLSSTLAPAAARTQPFVLLQTSTAQQCLDVIRYALLETTSKAEGCTLLFSLLYPPSTLVERSQLAADRLQTFDWTSHVPGYDDDDFDIKSEMLRVVQDAPQGPLTVIIDSVDTILSDMGSISKAEQLLASLLSLVKSRKGFRLVVHLHAPSPLTTILTQTRFSSSLTHVIAHPTALITHLATAYLTPPPPLSPPEKFWRVFIPIAERHYESEKLIFGSEGEGSGGSEFVAEILVRGADGNGRRRGVERVLEGWSGGAPCELSALVALKTLFVKRAAEEATPDPTQNLSFNLNLTDEQQRSRAQVPLPYAHEGKPMEKASMPPPAAILYDPDSADDLDDDDPDEDLDI